MLKKIFLLLVAGFLFTSCVTEKSKPFVPGTIESFSFDSKELKGNLLKESPTRKVMVYLPGNYLNSDGSYPVIYYLAGYGGTVDEIFNAANSVSSNGLNAIDSAIKEGIIPECIIVGISGNSKLGGSFYANSPVTGNWENHIVEIVTEIDNRYRTKATPQARGLAGYSMGGFGSIHVGLRNSDVFGYIYAYSPGVFGANGFDEEVWGTWKSWQGVLFSYGAAFDPDLTMDKAPYSSVPVSTMTPDEVVEGWHDRWSSGYGDAEGKVEYYLSRNAPLLGAKIDYAENDWFTWLIKGSKHFYKVFHDAGIDVSQEVVPGYNHEIDRVIVKDYILTYYGTVFK